MSLVVTTRGHNPQRVEVSHIGADGQDAVNRLDYHLVAPDLYDREGWLLPFLDWLGAARLPEVEEARAHGVGEGRMLHCYHLPEVWPELDSGEREIAPGVFVESATKRSAVVRRLGA